MVPDGQKPKRLKAPLLVKYVRKARAGSSSALQAKMAAHRLRKIACTDSLLVNVESHSAVDWRPSGNWPLRASANLSRMRAACLVIWPSSRPQPPRPTSTTLWSR